MQLKNDLDSPGEVLGIDFYTPNRLSPPFQSLFLIYLQRGSDGHHDSWQRTGNEQATNRQRTGNEQATRIEQLFRVLVGQLKALCMEYPLVQPATEETNYTGICFGSRHTRSRYSMATMSMGWREEDVLTMTRHIQYSLGVFGDIGE